MCENNGTFSIHWRMKAVWANAQIYIIYIVNKLLTLCCVTSGPSDNLGGAEVTLLVMVDPRHAGVVCALLRGESLARW